MTPTCWNFASMHCAHMLKCCLTQQQGHNLQRIRINYRISAEIHDNQINDIRNEVGIASAFRSHVQLSVLLGFIAYEFHIGLFIVHLSCYKSKLLAGMFGCARLQHIRINCRVYAGRELAVPPTRLQHSWKVWRFTIVLWCGYDNFLCCTELVRFLMLRDSITLMRKTN